MNFVFKLLPQSMFENNMLRGLIYKDTGKALLIQLIDSNNERLFKPIFFPKHWFNKIVDHGNYIDFHISPAFESEVNEKLNEQMMVDIIHQKRFLNEEKGMIKRLTTDIIRKREIINAKKELIEKLRSQIIEIEEEMKLNRIDLEKYLENIIKPDEVFTFEDNVVSIYRSERERKVLKPDDELMSQFGEDAFEYVKKRINILKDLFGDDIYYKKHFFQTRIKVDGKSIFLND